MRYIFIIMAEGSSSEVRKNTLPVRGKVQQENGLHTKLRQEWAVHEDGAFAYQLQNEEIDRHYGMNRFNRRTVREDIPIAKIVQTDEEIREQNERFEQLQVLRAQAEEDARVAKQMLEQDQLQTEAHRMAIELTDEEFAKSIQEKEKLKYERHLEKKRLKNLKKEREQIERTQQQRTEEAGLHLRQTSGSTEGLEDSFQDLDLEGQTTRVTPGGAIEDDGDFSDFYCLPENVDPLHRQAVQEAQDEELARLLQEQEHKRTKAEVDKSKLREIEEQDKRLAEIMQEQEKIRLKKAKQKWKQEQEAKRAREAAQRPPPLPKRPSEHNHHRYRRNSFIQSMENGPTPGDDDFPSPDSSEDYIPHMTTGAEQRLQASHRSDQALQGSERASQRPSDISMNNSSHAAVSNSNTREIRQNQQNVNKVRNNITSSKKNSDFNPRVLPSQDRPDVERWLASQPPDAARQRLRSDESEHLPDSPSPPGSYHSEDAFPYHGQGRSHHHNASVDNGSHYAVSDPFNFNIAAAIDPTYTRRTDGSTERKQPMQQQQQQQQHQQQQKQPPQQHRAPVQLQDRTMGTVSSRDDSFHDNGVVSPFMPVQGQKRVGGERTRKSQGSKDKEKCKQQ
ncbi:uncharacterized protein LOC128246953 isoform X2 [Mya arenaria]|uniref:uncharacterized protein LOC128246953 isoform X2 n=1 Tax=Mya arenaria TaxID=6604 RepID=UPI0022DF37A8|nr:uncharacterized protein LOC128246953 isoform X2 [Mya arenaria]